MADQRNTLGALGEKEAERYLKGQGYKIIEKNYRCKWGEIDLIAQYNEFLIFIEVKTRNSSSNVNPLISLTRKKQKKLIQLGTYYLVSKNISGMQPRFDVVSVVKDLSDQYSIEHLINAFTA